MAVTLEVADCKTATATAAPSTGITITKPSNLANGDVLYAYVAKNNYASTAAFTCSGWTEVTSGTRGTTTGNDRHLCILRKVITDAVNEPASYTFVTTDGTSRNMAGGILRVTGAETSAPEDATVPSITFASNDATPASRDITTATNDALVLQFCILCMDSGSAAKTWGAPSGYSTHANLSVANTAGSLELQVGVAYKTQATAGSVGTNAWTHTADDSTTENGIAVVAVRIATVNATVTATAIAAPAAMAAVTVQIQNPPDPQRMRTAAAQAPIPVLPSGGIDTLAERAWALRTYGMSASTPATIAASAIAAPATVPSVTVTGSATVVAAAVGAAAGVGAPTVTGSATVPAAAVAATASVPAITFKAPSTVTASAVAAPAALPSITFKAAATVVASAIAASATVPTPTAGSSTTVPAAAIAAQAGLEPPTLTAGATASVSPVAATATVPAATVALGVQVAVSGVSAASGVPAPTMSTGVTVAVSAIGLSAVLEAVTFTAPATVVAGAIELSAVLPAPTMSTGATVAPSAVPAPAGMDAPTVTLSATVAVSAIAATAGLGAPTLQTGATASVSAVEALASVPAVTVALSYDVPASGLPAPSGVPTPTVVLLDYFRPSVAQAYLGYGNVRMPTGADNKSSRELHVGHPYLALGNALVEVSSIGCAVVFPQDAVDRVSTGVTLAVAAIALEAVVPAVVVITVTAPDLGAVAGLDAVTILASSTVVLGELGLVVVIDPHVPFEPTVRIIDGIGCRATVGPHPRPQALRKEWGRQRIATDLNTPDVLRMGARNGR